ncbi:cupredoxin domain-containing protein [Nitrosomonas marina]|uniref:Uncharacterized copper-binding protein, cupredoxin-like subfamily n=1 Tax=Nitrosomonas marina TaxID=917 RepID=A0A1H8FY53_9PROT|nr:plastocyanin/azurin family copper-binding protein [Nitrosomonas marina]SEN36683.1 Uncharacterized copper-binding protein, cupredoxin-like subfamily [Nitrosomonas marina]
MKNKHLLIISLAVLFLYSAGTNGQMDYIPAADSIGRPGIASDVTRTIKVTLVEYMFLPNEIWVEKGETVRFVIKNGGDKNHEMLIGFDDDLRKAAKARRKHIDNLNEWEAGLAQLMPGEKKELVWFFDEAGAIDFACPLPGHFKGMRGTIFVETK